MLSASTLFFYYANKINFVSMQGRSQTGCHPGRKFGCHPPPSLRGGEEIAKSREIKGDTSFPPSLSHTNELRYMYT